MRFDLDFPETLVSLKVCFSAEFGRLDYEKVCIHREDRTTDTQNSTSQ